MNLNVGLLGMVKVLLWSILFNKPIKTMKKRKTKVERRLEVVKDAIKQLALNKLKAETGYIINLPYENDLLDMDENTQVQPLLQKLLKESKKPICKVCARGILLICTINKENNFTGREFQNIRGYRFDSSTTGDKRLLKLFSATQLMLIEEAFEVSVQREQQYVYCDYDDPYQLNDGLSVDDAKKAHRFHSRYKSDRNRLMAILKNIVTNRGLFKP
jgi:hypothetical protein